MKEPHVTPRSFDRAVRSGRSEKIVWTLGAIAQRIGVGPDFVRDVLAKADGTPVRVLGGRFYAFEDDLVSFMRSDLNKPF